MVERVPAIFEEPIDTKKLQIMGPEQLQIPGLMLFGHEIRTAATDSLPVHNHGNRFEIVFVCSGNPIFEVDGKTYSLSGGDVFLTMPHELHSTNSIPMPISEIYWMQIDFDSCANPLFLSADAAGELRRKMESLGAHTIKINPQKVEELISNGFQEARCGHSPHLAAQYLTLFLFLLMENAEHTDVKLTTDIGRAVMYILEHITQKLSLDDLASISYLSTSQFKQKFKHQMGVSPRQFINSQRIHYAMELLQEGYSTAETASLLQFDSPSYFISVFRQYTSCTPGEYKKKCQTQDPADEM